MNMQILTHNEGLVKVSQRNESKEVTTTSLKVAEFFNKRHTEVLRTIQNLECSPEFRQRNFASAEYRCSLLSIAFRGGHFDHTHTV